MKSQKVIWINIKKKINRLHEAEMKLDDEFIEDVEKIY